MTANSIVVPYYSDGTMMSLPYAESPVALQYIRKKKPQFIVLEGRLRNIRPFTAEWISNGIPDPAAKLIYSAGASLEDKIEIFSFDAATPAGSR
jgi:hypothetical protein